MAPATCKAMEMLPPETIAVSPGAVHRGKFFLYALIAVVSLASLWLMRQPHVQAVVLEWNQHSLWENVKRLVGSDDLALKGEVEGRINFLILGQGGAKHDGPYLTDTIMVASLRPATHQVALISLPRDLAVPISGFGVRKINSANVIGENRHPGQGAAFVSQAIGDALQLPIHYYARLSFAGFATLIDELGGVSVNVERAFTDSEYPTNTNGLTAISFNQGWQVMSGEVALQYVRSRHGTNSEGSDFARTKRQQQILLALKQKLLSPATFLNPSLSLRLYRTLADSIETDLSAGEAVRLAQLLRQVEPDQIMSRTFDTSPGGLLKEMIGLDGAYLLVPNVANFSELQSVAAGIFERNRAQGERARLEIQNGTTTAGLADATSQSLMSQGLLVVKVGNAPHQDFPRTLIYDYSAGKKTITRALLQAQFGTTAVALEPAAGQDVDFRIILGADQLKP